MELIKAFLLGIVQGITELLPISSSSHILFFDRLLSFTSVDSKLFASVIQMGSALAITLRLFPDLRVLASGLIKKEPAARSLFIALTVAFLPAAIFGTLFHEFIKETFYTLHSIAYALMVGGVLLIVLDPVSSIMVKEKVTPKEGFIVGLVQTLSLIPGFSRLGSTIIGGILAGLSRTTILKFSFLVAIPILLGAGSLDLYKASDSIEISNWIYLLAGGTSAFFVTYALFFKIINWLSKTGFLSIGWYRIGFGALLLLM